MRDGRADWDDTESPPHTVSAFGMQLHAATTVDGRDRRRLERVCRYLLSPGWGAGWGRPLAAPAEIA